MKGRLGMISKTNMPNLPKFEAQSEAALCFSFRPSAEAFCGEQIGRKSAGPPPAAPPGIGVHRHRPGSHSSFAAGPRTGL